MDNKLEFVKDRNITVKASNTYCEGIRLKIHSNILDASLILMQINFKITWEKFISDESGSILAENARILLTEEY